MAPETLWQRYAAMWSADGRARSEEIANLLSADVRYCDPNGAIQGHEALGRYMEQFQRTVPDGRFRIRAVHFHHDRSLADWSLVGSGGAELQTGSSFARHDERGLLCEINGFFRTAERPS